MIYTHIYLALKTEQWTLQSCPNHLGDDKQSSSTSQTRPPSVHTLYTSHVTVTQEFLQRSRSWYHHPVPRRQCDRWWYFQKSVYASTKSIRRETFTALTWEWKTHGAVYVHWETTTTLCCLLLKTNYFERRNNHVWTYVTGNPSGVCLPCHLWEGREVDRGFWCGNLSEKYHLENVDINGRIILKWIFMKSIGRAWTGLMWLRIRTSGGILWLW